MRNCKTVRKKINNTIIQEIKLKMIKKWINWYQIKKITLQVQMTMIVFSKLQTTNKYFNNMRHKILNQIMIFLTIKVTFLKIIQAI